MIYWFIVIIYFVIAYFAYTKKIKYWSNKDWEKICFSIAWVLALPLYGISYLHKKFS